jgi:hypothetical protein
VAVGASSNALQVVGNLAGLEQDLRQLLLVEGPLLHSERARQRAAAHPGA